MKVNAAIHWFRKGLRLHDNPALLHALEHASRVYPVYVMDPLFASPAQVGVNRLAFLLDSLSDLDAGLRRCGSRLYVVRGHPEEAVQSLCDRWKIQLLTFEADSEPPSRARDTAITASVNALSVRVSVFCSHTLHDPEVYLIKGEAPVSYGTFLKRFASIGEPRVPSETVTAEHFVAGTPVDESAEFDVPTLEEMGYRNEPAPACRFPGGETEALRRLRTFVIERPAWVAAFQKPDTAPNALEPATTVLSPYITFGCLSAARFYYALADVYATRRGRHSLPPVSLHGQLLWREYFYTCSVATPHFGRMVGNPHCRQIDWTRDERLHAAFENARTGYPFIDAIMTQLRTEGWIHHLARHALACFYTRGDLWQSWERGAHVFERLLLDADWALNRANWQWLSCSRWFYQYFRCYSPVAFGKKTDPDGAYIRRYLPQLARLPAAYIYEPWRAPPDVQRAAGCRVGAGADCDYPAPIVDHAVVSKANMTRMAAAYASQPSAESVSSESSVSSASAASSAASASAMSSPSLVTAGVGGKRKGGVTSAAASKKPKSKLDSKAKAK